MAAYTPLPLLPSHGLEWGKEGEESVSVFLLVIISKKQFTDFV